MTSNPPKSLTTLARNLRKQDTWAEKLLWRWLRDRRFSAYKFRRQQVFGPYILDFFCVEACLNIELDGSQHGFPAHQEKDAIRERWLAAAGVRVLRFWNARLRREKQFIRDIIWRELQARAPHPLPAYCQPIQGVSESVNAGCQAARHSPSPQPSPSGRGSVVPTSKKEPVAGHASESTEKSKRVQSLSPLPKGEGQGEGERSSTLHHDHESPQEFD
jgi:very-short-patch-repair endonuclease